MAAPLFTELEPVGRVGRRPQHRFAIRQRPWQIQPMFIAPVLPGETMKNLMLQARVVSDPVKHPLVGWWSEYYFFYLKHRDLADREAFVQMMLDQDYDLSALYTAANTKTYHYGATVDWTKLCLDRVVEEYFRNEGETVLAASIDGLPLAHIMNESWLDSVMNAAEFTAGLPPDASVTVGVDDVITAPEIDAAMRSWKWATANGLTEQSYEDFLRTYGVRLPKEETHKPELIRYLREWTYPANTIDAATGAPSSALSWSIQERADKDRFFKEPGFLFGVSVVRPKVYLSKQTGSAVGLMNSALSWLPSVLRDDPMTSLQLSPMGTGPIPTATDPNGYWVDIRDLLLYGDQFVNFALTETDAALVGLPSPTLDKRFASATDADALFETPLTQNLVRSDGIVMLTILGQQKDGTPTTS